jgi:hypothetical protein
MDEFPDHLLERIIECFCEDVDDPDDVLNLMLVNKRLGRLMRKTPTYREFQQDRMIELLSARLIIDEYWNLTHKQLRPYSNYEFIDHKAFHDVVDMWDQVISSRPMITKIEEASTHATFRSWVDLPTMLVIATNSSNYITNDVYCLCNIIGQKMLKVIENHPYEPEITPFEQETTCTCLDLGLPRKCSSCTCMTTLLVWNLIVSKDGEHISPVRAKDFCIYDAHDSCSRRLRFCKLTLSCW